MTTPRLRTVLVVGAVAATFALPFALGAGLHVWGWHPQTGGANGRLIEPPRALPAAGLVDGDGAPLPTAMLHGHWWLVLVGHGPCEAQCLERLDEMRRIHVALNRDMARLRRMLLTDGAPAESSTLLALQPDLLVAHADAAWNEAFATRELRYFILDPQARVMMRYPPDAQPAAVFADLMRLLRHSAAG